MRKVLFPSTLEQPDIADTDLDGDALLIIPFEEEVSSENVMSVIEVEDNGHHSEETAPETEERDVNSNVLRQRKRNNVQPAEALTRKRKVTPANWKATKDKAANSAGLAHTTRKGGSKESKGFKASLP